MRISSDQDSACHTCGILALSPLAMPEECFLLSHTTSQSATQGLTNAWVAWSAFLIVGLSALRIASLKHTAWAPSACWMYAPFGVLMISAAVFSSRHWDADISYDEIEGLPYSMAAAAVLSLLMLWIP